MKRPGDTTPTPAGGRVAARQRMFEEQRSVAPVKKKTSSTRAAKKQTKKR